MYVFRFSILRLTLLSDKRFLYIKNKHLKFTEMIGVYFIQAVSFK